MNQADLSKPELRGLLRGKRLQMMESGRYAELSGEIQHKVLADPVWKNAQYIFLYHACKGEVDTNLLLHEAWRLGKFVFLPRCLPGKRGQMRFFLVDALTHLIPSAYGIMEPPDEGPEPDAAMLKHGLIIVPGLAFDRQGFRLGYGGGYYDRLLALRQGRSLGLAFAEQLFDVLPRDPWDVPVLGLATEEDLEWL